MAAPPHKKLNVLVLGVGGNVSQGILKALAVSNLDCRVIGACTAPEAFGLFTTDAAYVSPAAADPEFVEWLIATCRTESVDVVMSGVEPVLLELARNRTKIEAATAAKCLTNSLDSIRVGSNKTRTCEWLRDNGFPYPHFADAEDDAALLRLVERCGFPLLAKPDTGKGSQGITKLNTAAELDRVRGQTGIVVQEYLGDERAEFTAACLTDRDDEVRGIIVFHRLLSSGTTSCATAGDFPELRELTREIARKLKPRGPCNVQMRMHRGRPVCFELNVRFSGTTPIRARLGFNDVEAAIRHYVLNDTTIDLPLVTEGQAIRYWNEAYVSPSAFQAIQADGELRDPRSYPFEIESYGQRS